MLFRRAPQLAGCNRAVLGSKELEGACGTASERPTPTAALRISSMHVPGPRTDPSSEKVFTYLDMSGGGGSGLIWR